jgi:anhydro-N-acetylmuramic acid kinase
LAFDTYPYPPKVREQVFRLFDPRTSRVDDLCRLNFALGELFAAAVLRLARKRRIPPASIDLIGSHGQTIRHLPARSARRAGEQWSNRTVEASTTQQTAGYGRTQSRSPAVSCSPVPLFSSAAGSTLQIGEPAVIAERTGIATVADFRPRDMAAGGQGAPLVPFADLFLFRDERRHRAVQNLGGIANVTWLPAGCAAAEVLAFDTGPGNMVIDRLAWRASSGARSLDRGGRLAARGIVDARLLAELTCHPFLARRPPKSTGREEFGAAFADRLWKENRRRLRPEDLLATATAFTARSIADAYERFLPRPPDEVILCGGGARNRTLVRMLRAELPAATRFVPPERFGVSAESREAVAFAILAWATAKNLAGNVPAATGAARAVVLGKIVPGR